MKRKQMSAFTLIELLVVIAIIALLLSIIMPSLNLAKVKATGILCCSRQHQLSLSLAVYSDDNDDIMPYSATGIGPEYWVQDPQDEVGGSRDISTIENRKRGIEWGTFFPYVQEIDFFHCPSDRRIKNPEASVTCAFRTYSIVCSLNSWYAVDPGWNDPTYGNDHWGYKKFSKVRNPSQALAFVEEAEETAGFNHMSWAIFVTKPVFYDPLAINHGDSSTLGFVDGHAELHKWRDEDTIRFFSQELAILKYFPVSSDNADWVYLTSNFAYDTINHQ